MRKEYKVVRTVGMAKGEKEKDKKWLKKQRSIEHKGKRTRTNRSDTSSLELKIKVREDNKKAERKEERNKKL